jgi:nucleoside-diphosphate-sugar epimerase
MKRGKLTTYLVTGVAGFIGRAIADALIRRGETVRGLDDFSTGKWENLAGLESMDLIEADLNDASAVAGACRGVDVVFHQAAIASVPRSIQQPIETHHANVSGTLRLLIAAVAAGVHRFIYAGSSSVYGDDESEIRHEKQLPRPVSPYGASKLAGEYYVQVFSRVYPINTVILRYFNVFGPYQDPSSEYSGVLARFALSMLTGKSPTIYGDGEQSRDFTYIDNVVMGNLLAADIADSSVQGGIFNIATGTSVSLNVAVAVLKGLTGFGGEVYYGPARAGDIQYSRADIRLACKQLGYTPTIEFREGMRRTVDWYKKSLLS